MFTGKIQKFIKKRFFKVIESTGQDENLIYKKCPRIVYSAILTQVKSVTGVQICCNILYRKLRTYVGRVHIKK